MGLLTTEKVCDNCGKDLEDADEAVNEDGHEFCSTDCREEYAEDHASDDHEDEEDREVCQFC